MEQLIKKIAMKLFSPSVAEIIPWTYKVYLQIFLELLLSFYSKNLLSLRKRNYPTYLSSTSVESCLNTWTLDLSSSCKPSNTQTAHDIMSSFEKPRTRGQLRSTRIH